MNNTRTLALLALVQSQPIVPPQRRTGLATATEDEMKMFAWFYEASKYFDHSEEALANDPELKAVFQITQQGLINLLVSRFNEELNKADPALRLR